MRRESDLKVRLLQITNRRSETDAESIVVNLLARAGEIPLEVLLAHLAEALYEQEVRGGARVMDLGLLGSGLFVAEARRTLEAGDGELWQIG